MAAFRFRAHPVDLVTRAGLDPAVLQATICAYVRSHHREPAPDPYDGPPVEEVVVTAISPSRGEDLRVEFTYWIDNPASRYDNSQRAAGSLRVSPDGAVVREGTLGPLEFRKPG